MNKAQDKALQTATATSLGGSLDKAGYMTDLNSLKINSNSEINDLKRARMLLRAVIKANP